jgi:hypothetical protein
MAAAVLLHFGDRELYDVKESGDVDSKNRRIVGLRLLDEGLGDKDAGVVDKRIDPSEPGYAFRDRAFGGFPLGDVTRNDEDAGVVRWLH